MGLKGGSQSGIASVDVAYAMSAFQEINKCVIEIRAGVMSTGRACVLMLELVAHDASRAIGEAPPWGSVRLELGYHNPLQMEAAILQALYRLDAVIEAKQPVLDESK
jgi:hypothetical protein